MPRVRHLSFWLACAALYSGVLALYWPSLGYGPSSLDDLGQLQAAAQQSLGQVFAPDRYGYVRPVKSLLFWIAARGPMHWAVLRVLMLGAVLLAAGLVQRLAERLTASRFAGLAVAACWALNPTTATVACWLSAANLALCLIAILSYFACARRALAPGTAAEPARPRIWLALALASLSLALLSSELAAVAPLLLWAQRALAYPLEREGSPPARLLLIASSVLVVLYLAIVLAAAFASESTAPDYRFAAEPAWLRAWSAARYALQNASFWLLPAGRFGVLLGDRPAQHVVASGLAWAMLVAGAVLLWKQRRRNPVLAFGLVWCALALAPVSNLVPLGNTPFAMHYAVLPGVGLALALVCAALALGRRIAPDRPRIATGLSGVLIAGALLSWLPESVQAVRAWGDSERLFAVTVANHPDEIEPLVNLASAQLDRQRYDRAATTLERASALAPEDRGVVRNQFSLLWQTGQLEAALALLDRHPAIAQRPEFQLGRGQALAQLGRTREAIAPLQRAFDSRSPEIDAELRLTTGGQLVFLLVTHDRAPEARRVFAQLASEYPGRSELEAMRRLLNPR